MNTSTITYAVNSDGFIRQCAWCWKVADAAGTYAVNAGRNLVREIAHVTHGICDPCGEDFMAAVPGRA